MKVWRSLVVLVFLLLFVGCGGSSMLIDYNKSTLWSKYRTYDWLPEPRASSIGPLAENPNHRTWIESTVDREMKRAGLRRETQGPELLVAYFAGIDGALDPSSWGYEYPAGTEWVKGQFELQKSDGGTITLDFVDAQSKLLVWRGALGGVVNSPGKTEESIRAVTKKIIENYPPR